MKKYMRYGEPDVDGPMFDSDTYVYPKGSPMFAFDRYIGDTTRDMMTDADTQAQAASNIRYRLSKQYNRKALQIDSSKVQPVPPKPSTPSATSSTPTELDFGEQLTIPGV